LRGKTLKTDISLSVRLFFPTSFTTGMRGSLNPKRDHRCAQSSKLGKQFNFNFRKRKMEEKKIVRLTETVQSAG